MGIRIKLRPEDIAAEIKDFNQKLTEGLNNLKQVGEIPCGVTPREQVFETDKVKLYHYQSNTDNTSTPLLIVYALVNRPYMADLQKNRSTIKGLLEAGQDVYLIDWGYPDSTDKFQTMDDYINNYLDSCVDFICQKHKISQLNLLGICQGGTFSLCYAALHPEKVSNLVTMVTPVDFKTANNMLSHWVQNIDVDLLVDTLGNIPGDMINGTFVNLKPYQLMGQKYLGVVDIMGNPEELDTFMHMEKWIFDSPDLAGETFRQFLKDCFQQNKLIKGQLQLGNQVVDLAKITMPVLNIYAKQDHLVPPAASTALKNYVGSSDYSELSFNGGHIGIYVSNKAQKTIAPNIGRWLDAHRR